MRLSSISLSRILSEGSDDFEVIVVARPRLEVELPREKLEAFMKLLEELGWSKSKLKRYVNAALRLRRLEREGGKSYLSLLRDYRRLSKEEVLIRYSIEKLKEKRRRIEEDLRLYMEQSSLTLELVSRVAKLVSQLRERGLDLEDLEKALRTLESMKRLGYDAERISEKLAEHEDLERSIEGLTRLAGGLEEEIKRLEERREKILREIEELHGLSGELEEVKEGLERLREGRGRLEEEIGEASARLRSLELEIERLTGLKASIEDLQRFLDDLEGEVERLREEEARLRAEIAELLGIRGEVERINERLEEARRELERLEKLVQEREAYAELMEGEAAAAYAILRLFSDPQGVEAEDLELIAQQLENLARVKRGEVSALKPLEPHLLDKARQSIISLVMPYIEKDLVPRKAFERLESELKRLSERRLALEEEVESLRKALEAKSSRERIEVIQGGEAEAVSPREEVIKPKTLAEGRRVRVICPYCGDSMITRIPTVRELEELEAEGYKLKFRCEGCGKSFNIKAGAVLRRIKGMG
ncbi:MAG: hypothetical protein DRJ69_05880 [Thermoprotei archaeon]|nr:MAG: hypothetical protein DRJ69_05880 [Thermoprotei archaeon]